MEVGDNYGTIGPLSAFRFPLCCPHCTRCGNCVVEIQAVSVLSFTTPCTTKACDPALSDKYEPKPL